MIPYPARTVRALLITILALGAALRLYGLNRESLWNDELSTMLRLDPGPLSDVFWERLAEDVHPPGYLLLLSGWSALFGNGEISLRLPSAIAGVALIAVAYAFVARAFGSTAGLLAALFCAVSPLHVRYSQEARSFALVSLTTLVAAWALVEVVRAPVQAGRTHREDLRTHAFWLAALVVSSTVSAYLSYVGLLALAALLAFGWSAVLWKARDRAPRLLAATVLITIGYLPWSEGVWLHAQRGGLVWLDPPVLADLFRFPSLAIPLHGWVLLVCVVAFGALSSRTHLAPQGIASNKAARAMQLSLAAWIAFALPIAFYLKSAWSTPIYNDRNLLVIVPFLALMAAVALAQAVPKRIAIGSGFVIASVILAHFVWVDRFYTSPIKQDFRGAAHLAAGWARDRRAGQIVCLAWSKQYFSYYLRQEGIDDDPACASKSEGLHAKLKKARTSDKPVAFIYGHIVPSPALWREIRKHFDVIENHPLHKAGAALLQPR